MSDLIYRQDAIDAICEACYIGEEASHTECKEYQNLDSTWCEEIVALRNVPSAEPEIIRCKDCKYAHLTYDGKCKYCDNWTDEYEIPEELYLDGDFYCGYAERRKDA